MFDLFYCGKISSNLEISNSLRKRRGGKYYCLHIQTLDKQLENSRLFRKKKNIDFCDNTANIDVKVVSDNEMDDKGNFDCYKGVNLMMKMNSFQNASGSLKNNIKDVLVKILFRRISDIWDKNGIILRKIIDRCLKER